MPVKPIPDGYHSITPYLTVQGVAQLIEFAKAAFDAKEKERIMGPDGRIAHAEVKIGDSVVMMGEARGDWKPMPGTIYLYTTDADATYRRALKAGATSLTEPVNRTARGACGTRSATSGGSPPTSRMWRPRSFRSAPRPS